jgi:hypothetical protein
MLILLLLVGALRAFSRGAPQKPDHGVLALFAIVGLGLTGLAFVAAAPK